jgi:hypothetical protein
MLFFAARFFRHLKEGPHVMQLLAGGTLYFKMTQLHPKLPVIECGAF